MWVYCYSHSCFTYNSKTGRRTLENQNLGVLSYNIYRSSSFYCTTFQRTWIQRYDIAYTIFYSWLNCTEPCLCSGKHNYVYTFWLFIATALGAYEKFGVRFIVGIHYKYGNRSHTGSYKDGIWSD